MDMDVDLGSVSTDSVLTLLECPVCLDHITPPVRQCMKGHLVCTDCFPRLSHCPTCRGDMCEERNLAMEQVSRLLQYPCRYHPMGCREAFSLSKKSAHERDCPFLQLKCPFHGQCAFNGALADVIPHLAAEHQVTPVPVQPLGTLFYRAKNFYRRNVWTLIFQWDDTNLFRLIIKQVHASQVGRPENGNLLLAHIQYVGPDSAASNYAYQISLFHTETRRTGHEFQGLVTSTLKPLESGCLKDDLFVVPFHSARSFTDQWANLNFIVKMKKMSAHGDDEVKVVPTVPRRVNEVTINNNNNETTTPTAASLETSSTSSSSAGSATEASAATSPLQPDQPAAPLAAASGVSSEAMVTA